MAKSAKQQNDGLVRFLDNSESSRHRRGMRILMRSRRASKKTKKARDKRTNRRTKRLPCCGRERRYCSCAADTQHMFSQPVIETLVSHIKETPMLTSNDPKDMAFILPKLDRARISMHRSVLSSALFRMYSKPTTYTALSQYCRNAVANRCDPDWTGMENKLEQLYSSPEPVWGGMFYPATLIAAKSKNGSWKTFRNLRTNKQRANRDVHVFKAVWAALCQDGTATAYLIARQRCSTTCWKGEEVEAARAAFAAWYDSFCSHMAANTRGWFGDYAMKCILDVGCNCSIHSTKDSQVFPDALLSKWPVSCPSYSAGLRNVLKPKFRTKSRNRKLKYKCLMYLHAVLSKKLGGPGTHRVPCTLAQLCWKKRQRT